MNQRLQQQITNEVGQRKWLNSPVTIHQGTLSELRQYIPYFERRDFTVANLNGGFSRINNNLDIIVRLPIGDDNNDIPINTVSKNYTLVQHGVILDIITKGLQEANIGLSENATGVLKITEYGERMSVSVSLPSKYNYEPHDGQLMELRLECLNSVDGSTRFSAKLEWFRLVCSNGLTIGVTQFDIHRIHNGDLQLEEISNVILSGLKEAESDKKNFEIWHNTEVTWESLDPWINKNLKDKWGFKAAARAYHIANSGYDAEVTGSYKDKVPTNISMNKTIRVPGIPTICQNVFDLSQILSWLAKERRDIQEQLQWREDIHFLIAPFLYKKLF